MTTRTHEPATAQVPMPMNPQALALAEGAWRRCIDGALALQGDAMTMMRDSAGRNVRAMIDIARCGNPVEALALQARYAQENLAEWLDGGQRMAERMTALWQENVAVVEHAMAPFAPAARD